MRDGLDVVIDELRRCQKRLLNIARIIEIVDARGAEYSFIWTTRLNTMTDDELDEIYKLASGRSSKPSKKAAVSKKKKSPRK